VPTGSEHVRVFLDEGGLRQIEVDGKPFPFYTRGDVGVTPVVVSSSYEGRDPAVVGYIVHVPIFVGEVTVEGGDDVLKSRLVEDD
jgi:hypothetical protein